MIDNWFHHCDVCGQNFKLDVGHDCTAPNFTAEDRKMLKEILSLLQSMYYDPLDQRGWKPMSAYPPGKICTLPDGMGNWVPSRTPQVGDVYKDAETKTDYIFNGERFVVVKGLGDMIGSDQKPSGWLDTSPEQLAFFKEQIALNEKSKERHVNLCKRAEDVARDQLP